MADIRLHSDGRTSSTSVPNAFIDEFMPAANGEFVKIYLYLLRQLNAPETEFSISAIADRFEHTEKDVRRALSYWERMNLLKLEYDAKENLTGVCLLDTPAREGMEHAGAQPIAQVKAAGSAPSGVPDHVSVETVSLDAPLPGVSAEAAPKTYSAEEIDCFRNQDAVAELLFIAERYLGRMLSATDVNSILYWYDGLGFSADLIEYLIEYCVSKGHTSIRYIEKVALGWADQNIRTTEEAKQVCGIHSRLYSAVMNALGITGRSLVPSETAYIEKWRSSYGFPQEVIVAACERTIQSIHQPRFEYIDSILTSWKKRGVANLSDVSRLDEEHKTKKSAATAAASVQTTPAKNRFNNFRQRSYDYDQLEKVLLNTSVQQ